MTHPSFLFISWADKVCIVLIYFLTHAPIFKRKNSRLDNDEGMGIFAYIMCTECKYKINPWAYDWIIGKWREVSAGAGIEARNSLSPLEKVENVYIENYL